MSTAEIVHPLVVDGGVVPVSNPGLSGSELFEDKYSSPLTVDVVTFVNVPSAKSSAVVSVAVQVESMIDPGVIVVVSPAFVPAS